jgi:hypothetical protein
MNDLMVISKEQCLATPFDLVKHLCEDKMLVAQDDPEEKNLITLLSEYERVGAKVLTMQTQLRLAGHRFEKKGLALLQSSYDGDKIILSKINSKGVQEIERDRDGRYRNGSTRWRLTKLSKTTVSVPLEVLQKLPDHSANKLVMFEDYYVPNDPIIAIPVNEKWFDWIPENLYIGVAKW